MVLYPYLIVFPLALATEVTFIPLVMGAVLALLRSEETGRWQDYLLGGVLLGAAGLTRSVVLGILLFILLWVWFWAKNKKGAFIILASVIVVITPWVVRNTRLHGDLTLIENAMGYTLYMGYHPETEGRFEFGPSIDLMPYLDDGERNQIGMEKGLGFIREAPERVPYLMLRKLGYFFGLERRALTYFDSNNFFGYIPQPWFTLIFLFFTLPFVYLTVGSSLSLPILKGNKVHVLIGLFLFGYVAPHSVLLAEPRFHLMIVPILAVYAVFAWVERNSLKAAFVSSQGRWKLVLAFILAGLLLFNWGFELWNDAEAVRLLFGPEGNQTYFPY
jgi:hypothetical protein